MIVSLPSLASVYLFRAEETDHLNGNSTNWEPLYNHRWLASTIAICCRKELRYQLADRDDQGCSGDVALVNSHTDSSR